MSGPTGVRMCDAMEMLCCGSRPEYERCIGCGCMAWRFVKHQDTERWTDNTGALLDVADPKPTAWRDVINLLTAAATDKPHADYEWSPAGAAEPDDAANADLYSGAPTWVRQLHAAELKAREAAQPARSARALSIDLDMEYAAAIKLQRWCRSLANFRGYCGLAGPPAEDLNWECGDADE